MEKALIHGWHKHCFNGHLQGGGIQSAKRRPCLLRGEASCGEAEERGCQEASHVGDMCVRSGRQGCLSDSVPGARLGKATCWAEASKPAFVGASGLRAGL